MEKEGRTRLALIICNKKFDYLFDREDAEVDILNMEELLQNLGYSVVIKENLTAQVIALENRATFSELFSVSLLVTTRTNMSEYRNYICSSIGFPGFLLSPTHIVRDYFQNTCATLFQQEGSLSLESIWLSLLPAVLRGTRINTWNFNNIRTNYLIIESYIRFCSFGYKSHLGKFD